MSRYHEWWTGSPIDIEIRHDRVPLPDPAAETRSSILWGEDGLLFHAHRRALIQVREGRHVIIDDRVRGRAANHVDFAMRIAIGALLHQRGGAQIHAATCSIGGRAVVITGPSMAGKSSFVASLARRGHRPIADDLTGIDLSSPAPLAVSWERASKLRRATVAYFAREEPTFASERVAFTASPAAAPPIAAILFIDRDQNAQRVRAIPLAAVEAVDLLVEQISVPRLAQPVADPAHSRRIAERLATIVPVYRLRIPEAWSDYDLALDVVEQIAATGAAGHGITTER